MPQARVCPRGLIALRHRDRPLGEGHRPVDVPVGEGHHRQRLQSQPSAWSFPSARRPRARWAVSRARSTWPARTISTLHRGQDWRSGSEAAAAACSRWWIASGYRPPIDNTPAKPRCTTSSTAGSGSLASTARASPSASRNRPVNRSGSTRSASSMIRCGSLGSLISRACSSRRTAVAGARCVTVCAASRNTATAWLSPVSHRGPGDSPPGPPARPRR